MQIHLFWIRFIFSGIAALVLFQNCSGDKGIKPVTGDIVESVYASGQVKASGQYRVVSNVPGILLKRHVGPGDLVKANDPVFTIRNTNAHLSLENALLSLQQAKANLGKLSILQQSLVFSYDKFRQDSLMWRRQKNLWENNVGSKSDYESSELMMRKSLTEFENAKTDLGENKVALEMAYEIARNNVKMARENQGDYVIRSTTAGKVYSVSPEEGEGILPQTPLAVIGKNDEFYLEMHVDENDISRIQSGQKIFVSMDTYKGSVFEARVTKIHPIMDENTSTFIIEGIFLQKPPKLYPFLHLEANILIAEKRKAKLIPRDYLMEDNYVLTEGGKKVLVKIGLKNFDYAELLSAWNTDKKIYKP